MNLILLRGEIQTLSGKPVNFLTMGANKPELPKPETQIQANYRLPLTVFALFLVAIILFPKIEYDEEYGKPKLHPKEEEKLRRRLMEIDDSEQYALIAEVAGWYPCLHSGRSIFYLKAGEVWKYGVTSKGKVGRYAGSFLVSNKVTYVIEFKGTFSECLKQEQIKLFNYRYLPENLGRIPQERLPRPPYNSVMR